MKSELRRELVSLREQLEAAFSVETAQPRQASRAASLTSSAGQCAAVAILVNRIFGGNYVSTRVEGESHWFNRILFQSNWYDVDITGDQYGLPPVQVSEMGTLYPETRLRLPEEVASETLERADRLALKANLSITRK